MNFFQAFTAIMTALFLSGSLLCATVTRLPSLLRSYSFSSIALGGLSLALALQENLVHLYPVAAAIVMIKGIIVPIIFGITAKRANASFRLSSALKPSFSWFVSSLVLSSGILLALRSPLILNQTFSNSLTFLLPISIGIIFLGFMVMIIRRDIFSQTMGFLVMENGIAAFSLSAFGSIPGAIEFGVYSVVLIGAVLMATLSHRAQQIYGSADTAHMNELID